MLKHIILAMSISLVAVACGGSQPEAASADGAKTDAPAADAKPEEKPAEAAPGGETKPAEATPPAGSETPK